jgi:hypothetical protein
MLSEDDFPCQEVLAMLSDGWSYPECQNHLEGLRTPIHQAARWGNYEKLDLLLRNINQRFSFSSEDHHHKKSTSPKNSAKKEEFGQDSLTKQPFQKQMKALKLSPFVK